MISEQKDVHQSLWQTVVGLLPSAAVGVGIIVAAYGSVWLLLDAPQWLLGALAVPLYICGVCLALLLYFIPTFIARQRKHRYYESIAAVNLLMGWTLIGYVVALAWALTAPPPTQDS